MLASIATSLLVPKVLGIEVYGYWQLFIFYTNYAGFFHFGLNDGVYLLYGGVTRPEIDKSSVGSQFRVGLVAQLFLGSVIALAAAVWAPEAERVFVLFAFAVYMVAANLASYFGYLFQAMNETRLFSFSVVLDRLAFFIPLVIMVVGRVSDFRSYVVAYLFAKVISLVWCCFKAKDILLAPPLDLMSSIRESLESVRVGFKLMIANVADMLILGVARGLVDAVWGIEAFGRVSLSLSLVNFFITFVMQASMVLFPALRRSGENERRAVYRGMRDAMEVALPVVYALYYPMVWLLSAWLPQYAESMKWLAILLPVCVFNTKMDVCCTTYFKVLREERTLLVANVVSVAASLVTSLVGVFLLNSLEAVLVGAVCCIVARSTWAELRLNREMGVEPSKMMVPEILVTASFTILSQLFSGIYALAIYCTVYLVYLTKHRGEVLSIIDKVLRIR